MKRQIRYGVFETNSSSTHSLSVCTMEEFNKWKNDENIYYSEYDNSFGTKEEYIERLKVAKRGDGRLIYSNVDWEDDKVIDIIFKKEAIFSYTRYFDEYDDNVETYTSEYTTKGGEEIIAFERYKWV